MSRSSGGNASARAVEAEPAEPEEEKFNTCGHCQFATFLESRWTFCLFATTPIPSDESGNLLVVIVDSGAEEQVVSLADWKSLGEPLLKLAQVRLRSATGDDMGVSGSFCGAWMVR